MGNQITVQNIIENVHKFKPQLEVYELVNQNGFQQNRMIKVWQHKFTSQRIIQQQYLIRAWGELNDLLEGFSFRYNNSYVLASKYLLIQNSQSIKRLNNKKAFPETFVSVFYEDSLTNLSNFKQIPQQDGAYFLIQSLKGFEQLIKKLRFPFQVKQKMFHITASRELKIWLGQNITDLSDKNQLRPLISQTQMIHQILQIIKANIFFTTESQKVIPQQNYFMPPTLLQELLKKNLQTFEQAIKMVQKYFDHYEIQIGSFMSCLKDLSNEELVSLMDKSKKNITVPHYATSTNQNSGIFINNSSQLSMKPFTPISQFSNQPQTLHLQRNYSMGNLSNNLPNQSQIFNENIRSSAKNSRSKSNKKSGLSLVKNQQKNYHSSIVIKQQKPMTSFVNNNQSPLKIQSKNPKMPPRSSSAKKVNFTISQHKQNVTPFDANIKKLQLSSHHSRGISITRKQQSQQKHPIMRLNPQSPFSRANNHFNTQLSSTINCSTVSIGPLPTPKYRNDSKSKTTFNTNNFSINFSQMSPSQKFAPNQSLTRFQKQNINYASSNPASMNTSVAQYYEMPKICVHSPKAQGKILRLESMSTEGESGQKPINYQPSMINNNQFFVKKQQDRIKEYQQPSSEVFYYPKNYSSNQKQVKFQTPSNTNKKANEFNNYIDGNNEIFTNPRLYQYITNNKSDHINTKQQANTTPFKRTQQKKTSYIDYLANVQISQSLDYKTADKLFTLASNNKQQNKQQVISPNKFTLNDFPTIEEIEQPPHSYDDGKQKQENTSFLPVQLLSNINLGSQKQLSTIRRGQQQSMVVEYKKFYDDTNRSINSPNKHYFSPLKNKPTNQLTHPSNFQFNMANKYSTAENWQASPPKPAKPKTIFNNNLFPIHQNARPALVIFPKQNQQQRNCSPSPVSKIIYSGTKQPAINPLILQDMQRIRQNRIY